MHGAVEDDVYGRTILQKIENSTTFSEVYAVSEEVGDLIAYPAQLDRDDLATDWLDPCYQTLDR